MKVSKPWMDDCMLLICSCDDDTVLKDDHEFDINGQRVRVWYRVNRFNEDKCKQLYSTS